VRAIIGEEGAQHGGVIAGTGPAASVGRSYSTLPGTARR
jgi:hypothetical protein